jgi:hypothetical protein
MTNKLHSQTKSRGFPQEVHQEAFALWYKLGRPEYKQIVAIMQEQAGEGNRVPTVFSIDVWHRHEDWDEKADALDGQAEQAGDIEIIKQRQGIIQKMADVGNELVEMGISYLREKGIESSADAIRAIGKGAELQDKLLGWAAYFAELSTATNEELDKKLKKFYTEEPIEATAVDATDQDDTERPE